ncbi:putative integral membrane protein PTH11 [Bisporella sp. PMI_857]|nr:putative integral membrane protein PTH11 [Bisporella sp. PMI_857]
MGTQQNPKEMSAMPPPLGIESNFDNPPSLHAWTLGVGITCMALMTLAVSIRTYTKAVILRDMKHEDYVAIFALVGFLAWGGIYIYLSAIGLTRDLWNIRAIDMPHILYLCNVFQVIYPPAMGAAKYFICIQLKRIFCPQGLVRGAVWWALQILIGATFIYYVSCFFTFMFQCVPREKIWNPNIDGRCIDNQAGVLSAGLINLLLDLGLLIVPIWAIWHLQMPLNRKLGAITIFAVGILFAELAGTMVVGCMPMFPRFYEHTRFLKGPLSSLQSLKSILSTRAQNSQDTKFSESSMPSRRIVVTSEFSRKDTVRNPDYIELRDGEHWRSHGAV